MTQIPWSHLPNAKHIDRVLASLKANPEKWNPIRNGAWAAARDAARVATYNMTYDAAWTVARDAAIRVNRAIWEALWETVRKAPGDAAWDAIIALIAYEDCAYMLDSDVDELKIIATLGDTRAILMLPACMVFNERIIDCEH